MSTLAEFREGKDHYFAHDQYSPLEPQQRREFQGLAYFPENPALQLEAPVQEFSNKATVQMITSTGDVATYRRWGRFAFEVDGRSAELTLYETSEGEDLFLPFTDATSGDETYGAGRYLEAKLLADSKVLVDFNYAYNPYCAYNDRWSCPIPPAENRLTVPIRAGEKNFPGRVGH